MIRLLSLDVRALLYGPSGSDFLSEVLRGEGIKAEPIEVTEALADLPPEICRLRDATLNEEQENDYYRAMLPALLHRLGVLQPANALLMRLLETVHEYHAFYSMYPEVLPVLHELKRRGYLLAVLSNWEPSLRRLLREFELEAYFTVILSAMEAGAFKPDPLPFRQMLRLAGREAGETLHAGPGLEEDVKGATQAGIRPVWVNRTGIPVGYEVLTVTDLRGLLLLLPQREGDV